MSLSQHSIVEQIVTNTSPVQCANVHVRRETVRSSAFSTARGQLNFVGDSRKVPSCSILSRKRWVRVSSCPESARKVSPFADEESGVSFCHIEINDHIIILWCFLSRSQFLSFAGLVCGGVIGRCAFGGDTCQMPPGLRVRQNVRRPVPFKHG